MSKKTSPIKQILKSISDHKGSGNLDGVGGRGDQLVQVGKAGFSKVRRVAVEKTAGSFKEGVSIDHRGGPAGGSCGRVGGMASIQRPRN